MDIEKLKNELLELEIELRWTIEKLGASEVSRRVGLQQPDISAWFNYKRNWTYNKIIEIAEILGL